VGPGRGGTHGARVALWVLSAVRATLPQAPGSACFQRGRRRRRRPSPLPRVALRGSPPVRGFLAAPSHRHPARQRPGPQLACRPISCSCAQRATAALSAPAQAAVVGGATSSRYVSTCHDRRRCPVPSGLSGLRGRARCAGQGSGEDRAPRRPILRGHPGKRRSVAPAAALASPARTQRAVACWWRDRLARGRETRRGRNSTAGGLEAG